MRIINYENENLSLTGKLSSEGKFTITVKALWPEGRDAQFYCSDKELHKFDDVELSEIMSDAVDDGDICEMFESNGREWIYNYLSDRHSARGSNNFLLL